MNKKIYKVTILLFALFIGFFINTSFVMATQISLPEYCTNPTSEGDIKNGHLCANSDYVMQCNASVVSLEEEGLPSVCTTDVGCEGYYYSFTDPSDSLFISNENSWVYRQMLCNGFTYNGKELNYLYTRNNKIYNVKTANPTFYEKIKSDISNNVADSDMGKEEAEKDDTGVIKKTDIQGIGGNSTDITIDCSGFSVLHTIYIIILIVSPILVIVLGTIDYAKSVMTSDMEKMKKFKKKLPVRIIALVLLITVPVIIDVIFTVFADNFNNNLMYCITKGTSDPIKLKSSGNSSGSSSSGSSSSTTDSEPELTSACSSACSAACSNRSYAVAISSCNTNCNNTCRNSYDKDCKSIPDTTARLNCYSTYATEKASNYDNNQDTTSVTDTTPGGSGGTSGSSGGSGSSGTDTRPTCSSCQRIQSSSDRSKCLENCRSDSSSSSSGSSSSSTSQCNNCNNIQDTTAKNNCKKLYCK